MPKKMLKVRINFTEAQLEALNDGHDVMGLFCSPKKRSVEEKIALTLPDAVMAVVNAWNEHPFICYEAIGESRNNLTRAEDAKASLKTITKCLEEFGQDGLRQEVETYFEACRQGKHIWDGSNHGYSHLGGFCNKLLKVTGGRGVAWWKHNREFVTVDPNEAITLYLADRYAQAFLHQDAYRLEKGDTSYQKFMEASRRVSIAEDTSEVTREVEQLIDLLIDCLVEHYKDRPCPAGALGSVTTWREILPQYLDRLEE